MKLFTTQSKMSTLSLTGTLATFLVFFAGQVAEAETYEVQPGDTLSEIAEDKCTTVDALATINNISNPDLIYAGDLLEIGEVGMDAPVGDRFVSSPETYAYRYQESQSTEYSLSDGGYVLSNGNTPGPIGSEAAARMSAETGVPQSTWEYIIARESNGQVYAYNPSGASGLFQTMPGWGSTATVDDQIHSALNAYNAQGLAAWGM